MSILTRMTRAGGGEETLGDTECVRVWAQGGACVCRGAREWSRRGVCCGELRWLSDGILKMEGGARWDMWGVSFMV